MSKVTFTFTVHYNNRCTSTFTGICHIMTLLGTCQVHSHLSQILLDCKNYSALPNYLPTCQAFCSFIILMYLQVPPEEQVHRSSDLINWPSPDWPVRSRWPFLLHILGCTLFIACSHLVLSGTFKKTSSVVSSQRALRRFQVYGQWKNFWSFTGC